MRQRAGPKRKADEFAGNNQNLSVAEVKLRAADQATVLPSWVNSEVSDDSRNFLHQLMNLWLCGHTRIGTRIKTQDVSHTRYLVDILHNTWEKGCQDI